MAEDAAASYSQSICPNLIFLIVDGVGPGYGVLKELELVMDVSHLRVISGTTTTSGTTTATVVFAAAVVLAVVLTTVEFPLVVQRHAAAFVRTSHLVVPSEFLVERNLDCQEDVNSYRLCYP